MRTTKLKKTPLLEFYSKYTSYDTHTICSWTERIEDRILYYRRCIDNDIKSNRNYFSLSRNRFKLLFLISLRSVQWGRCCCIVCTCVAINLKVYMCFYKKKLTYFRSLRLNVHFVLCFVSSIDCLNVLCSKFFLLSVYLLIIFFLD